MEWKESRKISMISFTGRGRELAETIKDRLPEKEIRVYHKPEQGTVLWTGQQFAEGAAVVFIGACGIAVRSIAPFVKDKLSDSPVLVVDETGRYVIPLLSGHAGGANELAVQLADRIGAEAVITTATDLHGVFAVDLFARRNRLTIVNREGIAKVSAKVLRGEKLSVSVEQYGGCVPENLSGLPKEVEVVPYPPEEGADVIIASGRGEEMEGKALLRLRPREYSIGIGCRKGKTKEEIAEFIRKQLMKLGIDHREVAAIASIDRKKDEEGICRWAQEQGIPFATFSEEELRAVKGSFQSSAFVEQTVGVDNVCERAALAVWKTGGRLVLKKQAENGMTLAAAKGNWQIEWDR